LKSAGQSIEALGGPPVVCPSCGTAIRDRFLRIQKRKLLIVEGKDEEGFFAALLAHLHLPEIQVAGIGGKTKIRSQLKALTKEPQFPHVTALGIIRDADADPKGAFESVKDALSAAGLPHPRKPLYPVKGPPKINVMILPSSGNPGALEDLCLAAVGHEPTRVCVDEFFDCLSKRELVPPRELSKAKVRTFLASQEDPTLPLGLAAQKGYWPFDNPAFGPLRQFLTSL
jgi:hypothetical protein